MSFLHIRHLVLSLALSLLWPATSFAQTPPQAATSKSYRWHMLALQHAPAASILKLMHWDKPGATIRGNSILPDGVNHVYALDSSNSLLMEATQEGFVRVRQIVKILDIADFELSPTISCVVVSVQDAGLRWTERPTSSVEVEAGTAVTQAFTRLVTTGHSVTTVKMSHVWQSHAPQMWIIHGYRLTLSSLRSDQSMTLSIEALSSLFPPTETPRLQQGDVVAVRETTSPDVTFIRVDQ